MIADLDLPFETRSLAPAFDHDVWLLPKAALAPYVPAPGQPALRKLPAHHATTRLLSAYLDSLGQEAAGMTPAVLHQVTDTLCRLAGIACGACAASEEQFDAVREARLAQANQYIERHLADPYLSPARVATALGVSLRSLHAVFESAGTSVARRILQQRLEECRATLLNDRNRPVIDIVFAWGFNSLSGFYQAF